MKKLKAFLLRLIDDGTRTLGEFILFDKILPILTGKMIELPWRNNEQNISCIPPGIYQVIPRYSKKHKKHFKIKNVPGREDILIHIANFPEDIEGCQGFGLSFADIDKDGKLDIKDSAKGMKQLLEKAPEGFTLEISSNP